MRLKSVDKSVMRCKKQVSLLSPFLCIALQSGLLVAFQNFDVLSGKIKENLNQTSICNFEMMLLNRYPYEKSEIIVYDYSIEVLSKL